MPATRGAGSQDEPGRKSDPPVALTPALPDELSGSVRNHSVKCHWTFARYPGSAEDAVTPTLFSPAL